MKKKILILNQGITANYGDVAINNTLMSFFKTRGFDVDYYPFWYEEYIFGKSYRKNKIFKLLFNIIWRVPFMMDYFNKRSISRRFNEMNYDAIIIGGGELLSGHRGFNSSMNVWTKVAEEKRVPVYLFGVSGDINMPRYILNRNRKSLTRFAEIFVRDSYTFDILKKHYNLNGKYAPDVVFAYNAMFQADNKTLKNREYLLCVPIAFNEGIVTKMGIKNIKEYFDYLVSEIVKNLGANSKVIITSSVLEDNEFSKKFYSYAHDKLKEIDIQYKEYTSLYDYINLLGHSHCVISGRMHALILAFINDCKVVTIPFKEKLICFNNEYSYEKDKGKVERKVLEALENLLMAVKKNTHL